MSGYLKSAIKKHFKKNAFKKHLESPQVYTWTGHISIAQT